MVVPLIVGGPGWVKTVISSNVEEQLGLKLERSRGKAPFDLVIKSVELPSENWIPPDP